MDCCKIYLFIVRVICKYTFVTKYIDIYNVFINNANEYSFFDNYRF